MQKIGNRFKRYFSLEFYYAVMRRDLKGAGFFTNAGIKIVAVLVVSISRFVQSRNTMSASAMTFYSVLAFIPLLALVLGIARGFGMGALLEEQIREQTFTNPQTIEFLLEFANHALKNSSGGWITGVGIVLLMWSVIKVLGSIEMAMNNIFGVKKGRSYKRKFTDYLSIMFIVPILMILIGGINVFLSSNLQVIAMEEGFLKYAGTLMIQLMQFLPYVLVWLLFIFLYMFMPTTPIRFTHALISGIIAGTVFQIVQWFYIRFQIGVSSYNAIYGSLAAFPLLLIWLQLSWSIILWGTELCFILKNRHYLFYKPGAQQSRWIDDVGKSMQILQFISSEYLQNKGGVGLESISKKMKINAGKLRIILGELTDKHILIEVNSDEELQFLPYTDLHNLSMADVIVRLSYVDPDSKNEWEKRLVKTIYTEFGEDRFF